MSEQPIVRQQAAVPARRSPIEFSTLAEVVEFAKVIQHADGMIPKAFVGNPGKIVAAVMHGMGLGVDPMSSLTAFYVVEGKPTASYNFWIARLKASGYRVEWPESGSERVTLRLTAPDGSVATETWDKERAVRAGLWGSNTWKKYPETMLAARCVTSLGRRFAAEVMVGGQTPDEAEEVASADFRDVTSRPEVVAAAADRVAAAIGATPPDDSAIQVEALARDAADMAKGQGMTRDELYQLMRTLEIEPARLSTLSMEQLRKLHNAIAITATATDDGKDPAD